MKKDWTDQLRSRMADYEVSPPEGLWKGIEQSLPQSRAKTTPLWQRWAGIAAVVAMLIGTGWWLWPTENPLTESGEKQRSVLQSAPIVSSKPSEPFPQNTTSSPLASSTSLPSSAKVATSTQESSSEQEAPSTLNTQSDSIHPARQPREQAQPYHPVTSVRQQSEPSSVASVKKRQRNGVSLGIQLNSSLMAYNYRNGVQMSQEMAQNYYFGSVPITRATYENGPIWLAGYEERQHHNFPVSIGLTLGYPLSARLTVSSGLTYTRLYSEFTTIMRQTSIYTYQRLHYIGIPLSVQYHLLKGRRWKGYVSAGAEIDWNISAKSKTEVVETPMDRDNSQWSLGVSLGVEYDILTRLGIYIEPGLRHYIDNGSNVRNYFKAHPTTWSLQFGIRLNLER